LLPIWLAIYCINIVGAPILVIINYSSSIGTDPEGVVSVVVVIIIIIIIIIILIIILLLLLLV